MKSHRVVYTTPLCSACGHGQGIAVLARVEDDAQEAGALCHRCLMRRVAEIERQENDDESRERGRRW